MASEEETILLLRPFTSPPSLSPFQAWSEGFKGERPRRGGVEKEGIEKEETIRAFPLSTAEIPAPPPLCSSVAVSPQQLSKEKEGKEEWRRDFMVEEGWKGMHKQKAKRSGDVCGRCGSGSKIFFWRL